MKQKLIEKYSELISKRPLTALIVIVLATVFLAAGASSVETVEQNNQDLLPDTIDSVNAFDIISSEFGQGGGGTTYTVLLESAPQHSKSNELRDVRDPELLTYLETVSNDISQMDDVATVNSAADIVSSPSTKRDAWSQMQEAGQWTRYISEDYDSSIMRISSTSLSSDEQQELAKRIQTSVEQNNPPPSIKATYTGTPFINQAMQNQTQNTMGTTSMISILGVLLVVVLLFRSIVNGLTSLTALIFGIIAGFGMYGWLGMNMSPATSGAISMGMGIAIDFGIQTVSRYREERKQENMQEALAETIEGILNPMTIALVAALIGFTSLSFGRITFLSDLGTMLTLTTVFAYIGALTIIPATMVAYDKHISNNTKVKNKQ